MARPSTDSVLALAAVCVLVVSAGAVVAAPTTVESTGTEVSFEHDVPQEYDFESNTTDGVATVDDVQFDQLIDALDAAETGDVVTLRGRFTPPDTVNVETANLTIRAAGDRYPVIDGPGEGDVLRINATDVTIEGIWIRNSGYATSENDAAVWIGGDRTTIRDSRITNMTFGIWVNGARNVTIVDNTIVGRESIEQLTDRGNGIQLWKADDAYVADNRITDARDGIYYSWATDVEARNNTIWDLRYGVHYMYSDRCTLANNTAFNNDVGYALMVSQHLRIVNNTAVNNTGQSGHGIMVKSIDHTTIRGNHLVGNHKGVFLYNSLDNEITGNLIAGNDVGIHVSAGSVRERVHGNTFVRNSQPVRADIGQLVAWNASERGNYWGSATPADVDSDGIGDSRYKPSGVVEHLLGSDAETAVFAKSPVFRVARLAESTLPVVESPGVVDYHPLTEPPHDWRRYYE